MGESFLYCSEYIKWGRSYDRNNIASIYVSDGPFNDSLLLIYSSNLFYNGADLLEGWRGKDWG